MSYLLRTKHETPSQPTARDQKQILNYYCLEMCNISWGIQITELIVSQSHLKNQYSHFISCIWVKIKENCFENVYNFFVKEKSIKWFFSKDSDFYTWPTKGDWENIMIYELKLELIFYQWVNKVVHLLFWLRNEILKD